MLSPSGSTNASTVNNIEEDMLSRTVLKVALTESSAGYSRNRISRRRRIFATS